jgi:ketosteroid isomerase-like protein
MRTPEETVRTVATGVCRLMRGGLTAAQETAQFDELAACYAEHTDVRHPLNPLGGTPLRSRAAVHEHFSAGPGRPTGVQRYDIIDDHVHMTADPEVVIFEFRYAGVIDGRTFTMPCIFVVRVRDGEIVESRDYVDHVAGARAFGRLPALAAALTTGTSPDRPGAARA